MLRYRKHTAKQWKERKLKYKTKEERDRERQKSLLAMKLSYTQRTKDEYKPLNTKENSKERNKETQKKRKETTEKNRSI